MSEIEYQEILWAEVKPDVYGGSSCGQVIPMWEAHADGDMDSDSFDHPITLDCTGYPPGTRVSVSVPCCPECGQQVELCRDDESCEFDWDEWILIKYS